MKSKNLLTLFACLVLIVTTFINVSIHKKQSSVLGQTISYCQKIGGYCTNSCKPSSTLRCLAGTALGCKTVYCAQRVTSYATPTLAYYTPIKPSPTISHTYPSLTPTKSPTTYIPTPTSIDSTSPTLGYIPCYEIQKVYSQYCQSTYPTFTPIPSPKLLTMTPVPSSTKYPTNTPTRYPTSTPISCRPLYQSCSSTTICCSPYICINGICRPNTSTPTLAPTYYPIKTPTPTKSY